MLNETAKENYKDINCFSHLESINTNKESISTKIKQYSKIWKYHIKMINFLKK